MLHAVINGKTRDDGSTGGVDVEVDWFVGIFGVELEHDSDDLVGEFIVDFWSDEDDAFTVETVVDVDPIGTLGSWYTVGYFWYTDLCGRCEERDDFEFWILGEDVHDNER